MALKTVEAVKNYVQRSGGFLDKASQQLASVDSISGGITNYVYRLSFTQHVETEWYKGSTKDWGHTAILKHANEYTSSLPTVPFPVSRQWFETRALRMLPTKLDSASEELVVELPKVLMYDEPNAVLILEDVAPPNVERRPDASSRKHIGLQTWLRGISRSPIVCSEVGHSLGVWLARLHGLTACKHNDAESPESKDLRSSFEGNAWALDTTLQYTTGDVFLHLRNMKVGLSVEEQSCLEEIQGIIDGEARSANQPLIMGDFWAGNVLLSLNTATSDESLQKVHVIDWEFVTCAPTYFDLAHFAAELWLDDKFDPDVVNGGSSPSRVLLSAMFSSYRASGLRIDLQKIIYYMSGHVCCFSGYAPRTEDNQLTTKVVREVIDLAMKAKEENWEQLRNDPLIASLMSD